MTRLKTRIAKMESQAGATGITEAASRLLVSLLGRRDSLFYPIRSHGPRVTIVQRQRAYLKSAEGISSKADGQGNWKDAHYARAELVAGGLVTATSSGGQITSMFITPKGDALANSMVWDNPSAKMLNEVSQALFLRLQQFDSKPWCGRKWISESQLFNAKCVGDPADWIELTDFMLPLLAAGLVVSNADAYGRLYYFAHDVEFPTIEAVEFPAIANAANTKRYIAAFRAESQALATTAPTDSNEIVIPIPASGW